MLLDAVILNNMISGKDLLPFLIRNVLPVFFVLWVICLLNNLFWDNRDYFDWQQILRLRTKNQLVTTLDKQVDISFLEGRIPQTLQTKVFKCTWIALYAFID